MFDFDCLNVSWREVSSVLKWQYHVSTIVWCDCDKRKVHTWSLLVFYKITSKYTDIILKNNLPCFLVYYLISTLTTGCLHPLRYFLLFFLLFHRPINFNWKFASIYHIRGKSCFSFRCGDKLPTHRSHRNCNWMPMEFRDLINIFTDHSMSKINQLTNFIYCFFSFHLQIYMWLLFGECKESK